MRVGSLFSGIGGMDAGLARAGLEHAFLCEIDEWRRGVLAARFPGVPIYDDVRAVGVEPAPRAAGNGRGAELDGAGRVHSVAVPVDLLCGGFPCQDLSVAGQRAGLEAGERSGLFFEFARVADELVEPGGWVLIENVPGLLSSQDGRDFALLLATLAELGFHDLAWRVLDSRHFGVPQRRRRVFILARRCARGRGAFEVLLEPEGGGGDSAAGEQEGPGVAYASLSGLGSGGPDDNDGQAGRIVPALASTLKGHNGKGGSGISPEDTFLVGRVGVVSPEDDRDEILRSGELELAGLREGDCGVTAGLDFATVETHAVDEVGHTGESALPARDVKFVSENQRGEGVRRLTPVECERLQGLPDGWTAPDGMSAPDSRRYAALGDAVTANVAEWIGRRLMDWNAALRGEASLSSSQERDRSAT